MKPIQGHHQFQAPHPQSQMQLDMGEKKVKGAMNVQGVQLVGCKTEQGDEIFEPRSSPEGQDQDDKEKDKSTVKRQSSIIKLSTGDDEVDDDTDEVKVEELKISETPPPQQQVAAPATSSRTPEPPVLYRHIQTIKPLAPPSHCQVHVGFLRLEILVTDKEPDPNQGALIGKCLKN